MEFDETLTFWYLQFSMRGPTLPFAMTKTYGPIYVDLREKVIFFFFLSFFSRSPPLSFLPSQKWPSLLIFDFSYFLFFSF